MIADSSVTNERGAKKRHTVFFYVSYDVSCRDLEGIMAGHVEHK